MIRSGILESQRRSAFTLLGEGLSQQPWFAYSTRKVNPDYNGACARIRRSTDSTELDIGFSSGVFDRVAYNNFVGPGQGFLTRWYDQGGRGNDGVNTIESRLFSVVFDGAITRFRDGAGDAFLQISNPPTGYHNRVILATWKRITSVAYGRIYSVRGVSGSPLSDYSSSNGFNLNVQDGNSDFYYEKNISGGGVKTGIPGVFNSNNVNFLVSLNNGILNLKAYNPNLSTLTANYTNVDPINSQQAFLGVYSASTYATSGDFTEFIEIPNLTSAETADRLLLSLKNYS